MERSGETNVTGTLIHWKDGKVILYTGQWVRCGCQHIGSSVYVWRRSVYFASKWSVCSRLTKKFTGL